MPLGTGTEALVALGLPLERASGCYLQLTVAYSLQGYLAMSWIKPELRLTAPKNMFTNIFNSLNTRKASSSNLTTPRPTLESTTGRQLKLLQEHMNHLRHIFPELPAPQG